MLSSNPLVFITWIRLFVDEIKDYFGSTIAIYFAFLEYYTFALVPLVLLVFFFSLFNFDELWYNLIFALINVLWGTLFLEFWKRNCATLTHRWGTLKQSLGNCVEGYTFSPVLLPIVSEMLELFLSSTLPWHPLLTSPFKTISSVAEETEEDPRPLYNGETRISPITGRKEIHYPDHHRLLKICCVSVPVVLFCVYIAIAVMSGYIRIQDSLNEKYEKETGFVAGFMTTAPSVVYTIVILVLNNLYLRTATKLNDWGKDLEIPRKDLKDEHV